MIAHLEESVSLNFQASDVEGLYGDFTNAKVCQYLDFIKEAEN